MEAMSGSRRYIVSDRETGELVKNYFVLRPDKDDAAISALRGYIAATPDKAKAEALHEWICEILHARYKGQK